MPNWKKVIVSGSDAALNSLTVSNGITGSLQGTASFATSASYALTAQTLLGSVTSASFASTASFLTGTITSASFASTASFVSNAFIQNGNSFGATALLGTNDNQSLALETSGSTRLFVSSSGNVGIRTSAPEYTLDVSGSARVNGSFFFATDGAGSNGLSFVRNGSNNWTFGTSGIGNIMTIAGNSITLPQVVTTNNGLYVTPGGNSTAVGLQVTSGSYPAATLLSVGANSLVVTGSKVGIGTSAPTASLHISGASSAALFKIESPSAPNILFVSGSGNVGIGTTTPSAKLEVNGNVTTGAVLNIGGSTGNVGELNFYNSVVKIARTGASGLDFYTTGGQPGLSLTDTSLFGIGKTSPNAKLDVSGSAIISGSITATGDITGSNAIFTGTITAQKLVVSTISSSVLYSSGSNKFGNDLTNTHQFTGSLFQTGSTAAFMGNVGIGTSSPAYTLDVNGSTRSTNFRLADSTLIASAYTVGGTTLTITNSGHNNAVGINVTSATGIIAASNLGVSNNNATGASIYAVGGAQSPNISLGLLSNRALITSNASGLSMHTSSMLQVDSTTQGFLPPRTNLTSNITSPAQGLITYLTGSANEGLYLYNSGSVVGWQKVLTNTGSISITGDITGSNALFTGTITAQKLVVQTITSSILYSSGSNQFGSQLTDIQSFTGSLRVTGSGNHYVMGGNVGIGITSPSSSLHVKSTTNDGTVMSSFDNSTKKVIEITDRGLIKAYTYNSTNVIYELGYYGQFDSGILKLNNQGGNGVFLTGAPSSNNYILNNVGIKTTTPNATLDVSGSLNISGSGTQTPFQITSGATSLMFVSSSGNVGIGTTTPNAKLDVSGSAIISGSLTVTGTITGSISSASYSATASYVNPLRQTAIITGSLQITGSLGVTGSINGLLISRGNGNESTNISIGATTNFSSSATGVNNFAAGNQALSKNTTGNNNTAIGVQALASNTTGKYNTAIGQNVLYSNTTGGYNTAIGRRSLYYNTTGGNNTAIGRRSLYSNTTGGYNTAIGKYTLKSNTTGNFNTAIGKYSLYQNTTGNNNTAIGSSALYQNTTGVNNTAIGYRSLQNNTTGGSNTAIGYYSLRSNTTGGNNTAIGSSALYQNTTGNHNTAIGQNTLQNNTTGVNNTAIGSSALYQNTGGVNNTAIGSSALYQNTTGNYNTAIGPNTLRYNTTGVYNTAIGSNALYSNTTGVSNTAIGVQALRNNTTGQYNTAIGYKALYQNTTGNHNTAIGRYSLKYNTSGSNNIAFGYNSGRFISGGVTANTITSASIFIGKDTQPSASNQINQIVIGDSAIGLGSNTVVLGNNSITTTALKGNVGIGTTTPAYKLDVSGSGRFTGGINVTGSMVFTGDITGSNALFTGTITAQKLVVQTITSSILYSSGSNKFGNDLTNTHQFTGSIYQTGSVAAFMGNVGIGETSPLTTLDIRTSSNTTITPLSSVPNTATTVLIGNTGTNGVLAIGHNNTGQPWLQGRSRTAGAGAEDILINPLGGNVGIGTTTPNARLDVSGSVNISGSGTQIPFQITSGSTSLMFVSSSGNVGIGTTSPAQTLHVVGTMRYGNLANTNYLEFNQIGGGTQILSNSGKEIYFYPEGNSGIGIIKTATGAGMSIGASYFTTTPPDNGLLVQGNVGIGTSGSVGRLFVNSLANAITDLTNVRLYANTFFGGYGGSNFDYGLAVGMTATAPIIQAIQLTSASADLSLQPYGGNVGIGVQSPVYRLRVDASGSANSSLPLALTSVDTNNRVGILFGSSSLASGKQHKLFHRVHAATVEWILDTPAASSANWNFLPTDDSSYAVNIIAPFATGGDARLYAAPKHRSLTLSAGGSNNHLIILSGSGNVGIGTTTPNAKLDVSGSAIITGSLTVTGTITGSISSAISSSFASTASFFTGTITSASFASTASYATTAQNLLGSVTSASFASTASFLTGTITSASFASTASFLNSATNAFIQNGNSFGATALLGTNDNQPLALETNGSEKMRITSAGNVGIGTSSPSASLHVAGTTILSSSFNTLISGSTLKVQGSGSALPIFTVVGSQGELFSINDSLSGSLFSVNDISGLPILEVFSDNTILLGNYQAPTLYTTNRIASTITGSNVIYSFSTSSYDGVFIDYTVKSGSNARAGNFAAIWSGTTVNYMDNSTTDFGSTAGMVLSGSISGSNLVVFASGSSAGWTFKGIIKAI